jgi:hypothetical protein
MPLPPRRQANFRPARFPTDGSNYVSRITQQQHHERLQLPPPHQHPAPAPSNQQAIQALQEIQHLLQVSNPLPGGSVPTYDAISIARADAASSSSITPSGEDVLSTAPPAAAMSTASTISNNSLWQTRFHQVQEFFQSTGHLPTPKEHPVLARWVYNNRSRLNDDLESTNPKVVALAQDRVEYFLKNGINILENKSKVSTAPCKAQWDVELHKLDLFHQSHGRLPTNADALMCEGNKKIANWYFKNRYQLKMDLKSHIPRVAAKAQHRVERFREIGIDILAPFPYKKRNFLKNHGNWKDVIADHIEAVDDSDAMAMLGCYLQDFVQKPGWDAYTDFSCLVDYVLKCLKVGDILPSECTREQPVCLQHKAHPELHHRSYHPSLL